MQFWVQNLLCELNFQILWTPFTNKSFLHPRGILKCIERESQFFCWRGKNVDRLNPDVFVITCCNCILTHNHVSEWGERVEQGGDFQIKGAEWHFTWCVTWYISRLCTFRNLLRIGEVHKGCSLITDTKFLTLWKFHWLLHKDIFMSDSNPSKFFEKSESVKFWSFW